MMGYNIRSKNYFGQSFENQYGVNILEIENTKIQFRLLDGDS